jgi:UDP-N-acetylglucosamine transferase subunit ALG13
VTTRITVLLGTDHHDFSRLVHWADGWQRQHPDVEVLVQHGSSPAPAVAEGAELVPPTELVALLAEADVVVTHGGPGTIMAARHAGHRPLAVPRDPTRGEHVDEHQMRFVSWAAKKGLCDEVTTVDQLSTTISDRGERGTRSSGASPLGPESAIVPVADLRLLDEVVSAPRRRRDPSPTALQVVYVLGDATTALPVPGSERLLHLGEVSGLWMDEPHASCSCGRSRVDCAFWDEVCNRAFGGWEGPELGHLREVHRSALDHPLAMARRHPGRAVRERLLEVALGYRRACRAALELDPAAGVVMDGGTPSDALLLSHCRELALTVLSVAGAPVRPREALALRYRGLAPAEVPAGAVREQSGDAAAHQLVSTGRRTEHGSITR